MKSLVRLFTVAISIVILAGCGNEPKITIDTAPFEKSIAAYCRSHHYGMKVKKFLSLKVDGNQAQGAAKMEAAEGTYGLAVKWEFKFKKEDGKWKTVSHTAK
jgi:hypothetical protein